LELGVPAGVPRDAEEIECVDVLLSLLHGGFLFLPTDEDMGEDDGTFDEDDDRVEIVDL
jgi:hypothetical protein